MLTLTCTDRVGIVAGVSGFLAEQDGFILDSQQYADLETGRFFMRVVFTSGGPRFPVDRDALVAAFTPVATRFELDWGLSASDEKPALVVAVSKGSHCLNDLLHRQQAGTLSARIVAVVSNHEKLRGLTEWHGVPYHYLPVEAGGNAAQEHAIEAVMESAGAPYLVLARYMQVLTPEFADRLAGRCINIHHSFLPGFKGAKPYHRAHDRGVKLIGATAHFVTSDLDEGPIIDQAVERVDHRDSVDDLIRIGRDIEAQVLARAVDAIGARRVFLNGNRTVVFR
ncbi:MULTISPECIES: formyltetrahydrofolate deformylase [unclassified Sphingomonas]|uniref:formyltetrahydrofolate deformylase n=1 Tax=unclassified Sphingomonas TaxID=196159 RepID=UPI00215190CA|nr:MULTISPECIES: formyltetrahydrofolate deformylase [unclassified Sphingomonas]MCR5870161.1 formyltetrahydrofolate deformylase [Sphingomonas sp. J344]UUY01434.1 formyltetrahydrofolate deformylase [Sphingomonas sp. J315]